VCIIEFPSTHFLSYTLTLGQTQGCLWTWGEPWGGHGTKEKNKVNQLEFKRLANKTMCEKNNKQETPKLSISF
jgi:hypothetical protein